MLYNNVTFVKMVYITKLDNNACHSLIYMQVYWSALAFKHQSHRIFLHNFNIPQSEFVAH